MLTEETLGFQEGRKSNGMGKSKGEQTTLLMSFVKTLKGEGKKNITQIGAQCMKILKTIILKNRECKGTQ